MKWFWYVLLPLLAHYTRHSSKTNSNKVIGTPKLNVLSNVRPENVLVPGHRVVETERPCKVQRGRPLERDFRDITIDLAVSDRVLQQIEISLDHLKYYSDNTEGSTTHPTILTSQQLADVAELSKHREFADRRLVLTCLHEEAEEVIVLGISLERNLD